jgi:membrane-associated phospholipid phosphatase
VPLTGAAVIAATDGDRRLSDWAREKTPVFGSHDAALDASDRYRLYASGSAWAVFAVAPPHNAANWAGEKTADGAGNLLGLALARNTTGVLKPATHRERPHGGPVHDSFPSAHATDAFAHASMARYYANDFGVGPAPHYGIDALTGLFAAATAWGRVEGGVHYPTDVLVGAALANFTTRFILELNATERRPFWRTQPQVTADGDLRLVFSRPF